MADELPSPHSPSTNDGATFLGTCFNVVNALTGIGLMTIPYTLGQAGWLALVFLIATAIITCYTGILIQRCVDSKPSIKSYVDIGSYAFGDKGKILISTFVYLEVYLVPTGFLILEGDNLHKLFPQVGFIVKGHAVQGKRFFTIIGALVILPTMWMRDFSKLSFVSATGVFSSLIIIVSIFWVGAVDGVGFSANGDLFHLGGIPTALSLYAFCYSGHPVVPALYSSMKDKRKFAKVLQVSFGLATLCCISMAVIGYLMFGKNVQSQVTLSLPTSKVSSKVAIYTILAIPIAKYALIFSPIPIAVEHQLPAKYNTILVSILIRTLLLISSLVVALGFPFFSLLGALSGAILNVTVSILFPCSCYLKISGGYRKIGFEAVIIWVIMVIGVVVGVVGTCFSVKEIVKHI